MRAELCSFVTTVKNGPSTLGRRLQQQSNLQSYGYVAFFSDIEHEVTSVTSGHRITSTYNLYWWTCLSE
jgi:predicted 2-oxoglutarate/Fe(II)-dependent dioxygenase YbiX